jgi:hypothetical protein
MSGDIKVRTGWLKGMYIYTLIGAGLFGLGIIIIPETMKSAFGWPSGDPIPLGITGSVYVAFALLSVFGLRSPLKFSPVLLLQLCYKSIWFLGVVFPLIVRGEFPAYSIALAIIFATYIIGDAIAIPFSYVLFRHN